jgi:hypothetical protein
MGRPVTPTVLWSRSQRIIGMGFGFVVVVLGFFAAAQATYTTGKIGEAVVGVGLGGAMVAAFARAAVVVRDDGIVIGNTVGTTEIPWSNIVGFRIGRCRLLSAVCIIDLADGSTRHAFAIQLARALSQTREMEMIAFLNEQAAIHRRPISAQRGTGA